MTAVGIAFISLIIYGGYTPKILNATWASTNFISGLSIAPLMMWLLQNTNIRFKPLEIVGRASYHIFLVQMEYYLGYYQKTYAVAHEQNYIHLALGVAICLLVGIIFYYVDKPLQDWIRKKLRRT